MQIIECVPNFSEGRDLSVIEKITDEIKKIKGVSLLDVDPGYDTNRTVVTMVGEVEAVKLAAFNAVKKSHELIDMSKHKGAHPRFGSCDVCPIIPVAGITMDECVKVAHDLGKKLGNELDYPIYFYEHAASTEERRNLAYVRSGEYEALADNLKDSKRKPDIGPATFKPRVGATAVSAREFLIAYNINLNTKDTKAAKDMALDIREQGRWKRDENGKLLKDEKGKKVKQKGFFQNCKAIGWYVEDFKRAQISINLTNYKITSMHHVFDKIVELSSKYGVRVTGSEIVGVVPKQALLDAGIYYLEKQNLCAGTTENELIEIAKQSLGLSDLYKFENDKKIIEYMTEDKEKLVNLSVADFNHLLSTDSPAPGGGSVAALAGSLAASLGSMVMNLTYDKPGYEKYNEKSNEYAKEFQLRKEELLALVDEDTIAFNNLMDKMIPRNRSKKQLIKLEKSLKKEEVSQEEFNKEKQIYDKLDKDFYEATVYAADVPLKVMERILDMIPGLKDIAKNGNYHAVSDAGVAALMIEAGVKSAGLNVKINLANFENDDSYKIKALNKMNEFIEITEKGTKEILKIVNEIIG